MNQIILSGRLTRDPELRMTQNNTAVVTFCLAVDRRFKSSGEPDADFINVVAWRKTAEFVAKYFTKGRKAIVSGSLQSRSWTDKDGNKRTTFEVNADQVEFADSKKTEDTPQREPGSDDFDEELPF